MSMVQVLLPRMIPQGGAPVQRRRAVFRFCPDVGTDRTVTVAIGRVFGYSIPVSIQSAGRLRPKKGENKMDMEELGYLLYMEAMDKKEQEEAEKNPLDEDENGEDEE